jgi:hypothetical protein
LILYIRHSRLRMIMGVIYGAWLGFRRITKRIYDRGVSIAYKLSYPTFQLNRADCRARHKISCQCRSSLLCTLGSVL